jgi:hypothetical protein
MRCLLVDNSVKLQIPKEDFVVVEPVSHKSSTRRDTAVEGHIHSGHTELADCVTESLIAYVSRGLGGPACGMSFGRLLNPG